MRNVHRLRIHRALVRPGHLQRAFLPRAPARLVGALCVVALLVPIATASASVGFAVTLTIDDPAEALVTCEARLTRLAGPLTLAFPERYAYATLEPRLEVAPVAVDERGLPLTLLHDDPFAWTLEPGEAHTAHLTWTVRLDHRDQPGVAGRDEYEHPYLEADHGLLVAGALVLAPRAVDVDATLRFRLPAGWPVFSPWPECEPGVYAPSARALSDDLIAVGAWHVTEGDSHGLHYTVAFAPGQDELRRLVMPRLPPIIESEVALFGGAPQSDYLFVFGRPDQVSSYGGSPKAGSMTLFVARDLPLEFAVDSVTHLIAHEYHHTWMKSRCAPQDDLRFVMEGFTDWYATVVPWRLGLVDDPALLATLEGKFAEAQGSLAAFGGSLADAGGPEFFTGGDAYQACYSGGLLMALWTDLALRAAGEFDGLDGLLRAFYNDERWSDGTRPDLGHWLALLGERLGPDAASLQADAVRRPSGPDWPALFRYVDLDVGSGSQAPARLPADLLGRLAAH